MTNSETVYLKNCFLKPIQFSKIKKFDPKKSNLTPDYVYESKSNGLQCLMGIPGEGLLRNDQKLVGFFIHLIDRNTFFL